MTDSSSIVFEASPALLAFRYLTGSANFFLNTLVVGLETLRYSYPIKPYDLAISWSKPGKPGTYDHCRQFALKMMMVTAIDSIDQYLRILTRIPRLVDPVLEDALNGRTRIRSGGRERRLTISERLQILSERYPAVRAEWIAGIHFLVYWRNTFVHGEYKFALPREHIRTLIGAKDYFFEEHRGADIQAIVARFDMREPPALADLSTLLSITHRCITAIDERILSAQIGISYAEALLRYLAESSPDPTLYVRSIWQRGPPHSVRRLTSIFMSNGGTHKGRHASAPRLTRPELEGHFGFGLDEALALLTTSLPTASR
jgi:hypothetical protein